MCWRLCAPLLLHFQGSEKGSARIRSPFTLDLKPYARNLQVSPCFAGADHSYLILLLARNNISNIHPKPPILNSSSRQQGFSEVLAMAVEGLVGYSDQEQDCQ